MELGAGISSKGQVTVPKEVRLALGLKTGDRVYFVPDGEKALMVPARGGLLQLRGILKKRAGAKGPIDFKTLRQQARQAVGRAFVNKTA